MTPPATALRILLIASLAGACGAAQQDGAAPGSDPGPGSTIGSCSGPGAPSYAASPAALAEAAHAMIEGTVQDVVAEWEPLHMYGEPLSLAECRSGLPMLRITLNDVISLRGEAVPGTVTVWFSGMLWRRAVYNRESGASDRLDVGDTDASPLLSQANFLVPGQTVGFFVQPREGDASYLVAPTSNAPPYVVENDMVTWVPITYDGNPYRPSCGGPYVDFDAVSGMTRQAAHAYFRDEPAPNNATRDLRAGIERSSSSTNLRFPICQSTVSPRQSSPEDSGL